MAAGAARFHVGAAACSPPSDEKAAAEEQRPHTNDMVDMALNLQKHLEIKNGKPGAIPVNIRIGIHVGQVLAGIIGKRKFQYDIFGHAVHIAEEMESSGQVGKVRAPARERSSGC